MSNTRLILCGASSAILDLGGWHSDTDGSAAYFSSTSLLPVSSKFSCFPRYSRGLLPLLNLAWRHGIHWSGVCESSLALSAFQFWTLQQQTQNHSVDQTHLTLPYLGCQWVPYLGCQENRDTLVTGSEYCALGQEKLPTADNVCKRLLFLVLSICIVALTFLFTPPVHCKA